ncbi:MAG: DMT family transporter [Hyphomonadaceae bacterium]
MTDTAMLALALGLFSAVTLAAANTFVKASGDVLAARSVMTLSSAVIMAPFAFFVPPPNAATWTMLAFSLPAHWLYQTALVRALSRGDLSLVFPVMRGTAPLLTALAASVFLKEHLSPLSFAGLVVASLAAMIFALPDHASRVDPRLRRSALIWAVVTGLGVAIYNVIDAKGTRVAPSPFTFTVWLFMLDWIGVNAVTLATRRGDWFRMIRTRIGYGAGAGMMSILSFGAALYGFSIAPVAYISAMRETAVVFAAFIGWMFLKEGFGVRRTLAAIVLAAGLSLLQFG